MGVDRAAIVRDAAFQACEDEVDIVYITGSRRVGFFGNGSTQRGVDVGIDNLNTEGGIEISHSGWIDAGGKC